MIVLSWIRRLGRHALQQKWGMIDAWRSRRWEKAIDDKSLNYQWAAENVTALLEDLAPFFSFGSRGYAYYIDPQDIVLIARLCRSPYFSASLDGDSLGGLQTDRGMLMIFREKRPPVPMPSSEPPGYTEVLR